jgi:hypothetical protein
MLLAGLFSQLAETIEVLILEWRDSEGSRWHAPPVEEKYWWERP